VQQDLLAEEFETHRGHLRAVGYRMLGSVAEAEDAVQDAWLRLSRTDADQIDNLGGWLTTVVSRICLDQLRARKARKEDPAADRFPDLVVIDPEPIDPEHEAVLSDSLGLAIMVVLDELGPAERLAFVLHDVFGLAFAEIAPIVERSTDATKMLASRARRRVQDAHRTPDADLARQRAAVDAFQSAARAGDFEALLQVLDPDVVLRNAGVDAVSIVRGAAAVASGAVTFQRVAVDTRPVLVDGVAGAALVVDGKVTSVAAFTVVDGRIVEIDIVNDPQRLRGLVFPVDAVEQTED
jgi:RNA polymerase sigma-70 factor, ECF subfamily